jgi:hypothetical protein
VNVEGEQWNAAADIFEATYEVVEATPRAKYLNLVDGKIYELVSLDGDGVSFRREGRETNRYLSRAEFDRRFQLQTTPPQTKAIPEAAILTRVGRKLPKLPPIGDELHQYYPSMSAQTHEELVKDYARRAVRAALAASEDGTDLTIDRTATSWTAPIRLTDNMLDRMIDNGEWGMERDLIADQLRGAWAEARYATPAKAHNDDIAVGRSAATIKTKLDADAVIELCIEQVRDCVLSSPLTEYLGLADHAAFDAGQDNAIATVIKVLTSFKSTSKSEQHSDDIAVDRFAAAMKTKLAEKRGDGRSGWDNPEACSVDDLNYMLIQHLFKGDPIDIGNFAMMIHQRGGRIAIDDETAETLTGAPAGGEIEAD